MLLPPAARLRSVHAQRKQINVIAFILSLPLILLTLTTGLVVPWLALRLEMTHRAERRLEDALKALETAKRLVRDQASTIEAYRELVALDGRYALAPLSPSPQRWAQLARAARGS